MGERRAEILACGLNASEQLGSLTPSPENNGQGSITNRIDHAEKDTEVHKFRLLRQLNLIPAEHVDDVLFAGWGETVLTTAKQHEDVGIVVLGKCTNNKRDFLAASHYSRLRHAIGDHEGMQFAIASLNVPSSKPHAPPTRLDHLISFANSDSFIHASTDDPETRPRISHVAHLSSGTHAVIFSQGLRSNMLHIAEFNDAEHLRCWNNDPSNPDHTLKAHHMLAGRALQLLGNDVHFTLLLAGGQVYTWGDPRLRTLGRSTSSDIGLQDGPGLVEDLEGLGIMRIASCSLLTAALSDSGGLYLWGGWYAGNVIEGLKLEVCHLTPTLQDIVPNDEERDVKDVAVGAGHVLALLDDGRVYALGNGCYGQLGVGLEWASEWTLVTDLDGQKVRRVVCGPSTSFAICEVEEAH